MRYDLLFGAWSLAGINKPYREEVPQLRHDLLRQYRQSQNPSAAQMAQRKEAGGRRSLDRW